MTRIVLGVDIEVFQNAPKWSTIGMIIAKWPCGSIIDTFETGCMRGSNTLATDKVAFWGKHTAAYEYNNNLCKTKKVYEEEERISTFLSKWLKQYPSLYIVSDNPAFDIAMLQTIYQNHAIRQKISPVPSIMIRNHIYYQPICTWSMKRTIQLITGINAKYMKKYTERDIYKMSHDLSGIIHTPLFDTSKIIDEYLTLLDFIQLHKHNM